MSKIYDIDYHEGKRWIFIRLHDKKSTKLLNILNAIGDTAILKLNEYYRVKPELIDKVMVTKWYVYIGGGGDYNMSDLRKKNMDEWIENNIKTDVFKADDKGSLGYFFKTGEDAMAFKLRWS